MRSPLRTIETKQQLRQIPLKWILIVPFVLQTVGAVGIVGYLSYRNGQKAIENLSDQLMSEVGHNITHHLDTYLEVAQQVNQVNKKVIQSGIINPNDFEKLGKYFWQQLQSYDFTYINYGNEKGEFIGTGYVKKI